MSVAPAAAKGRHGGQLVTKSCSDAYRNAMLEGIDLNIHTKRSIRLAPFEVIAGVRRICPSWHKTVLAIKYGDV